MGDEEWQLSEGEKMSKKLSFFNEQLIIIVYYLMKGSPYLLETLQDGGYG